MNFSHIHPKKDFAFYLIDNFFDIKQNHENLWKHSGNGKQYTVPKEIREVLIKYSFFVPENIN